MTDLTYIGPFPPPVHGQSVATRNLAEELRRRGTDVSAVNLSSGQFKGTMGRIVRSWRHLLATGAVLANRGPVYISVNSNNGMWLTAILAGLSHLRRRPLFLHHHAYDHIRRRRGNMVWLARLAGSDATHITLGNAMAQELIRFTPEVGSTFILNNAGLVDQRLLDIPTRLSRGLVLGHLSNLTTEKGMEEVVALAVAAKKKGLLKKLILAGPADGPDVRQAVSDAQAALGADFEYRGPVHGHEKFRFFRDITCFVFPTRYRNEASPLVLLEALAAGVPCVSYGRACIPEDLGETGGVAVPPEEDFVSAALSFLEDLQEELPRRSVLARQRFQELMNDHNHQLEIFCRKLAGDTESDGRGEI